MLERDEQRTLTLRQQYKHALVTVTLNDMAIYVTEKKVKPSFMAPSVQHYDYHIIPKNVKRLK